MIESIELLTNIDFIFEILFLCSRLTEGKRMKKDIERWLFGA